MRERSTPRIRTSPSQTGEGLDKLDVVALGPGSPYERWLSRVTGQTTRAAAFTTRAPAASVKTEQSLRFDGVSVAHTVVLTRVVPVTVTAPAGYVSLITLDVSMQMQMC